MMEERWLRSLRSRVDSPDAQWREVLDLAHREVGFGLDLYVRLCDRVGFDANVVFSPWSVWQAMAMLYAGARGGTARAMARTLRLPESPSVHAAMNWLEKTMKLHADEVVFRSANRVILDRRLDLEPAYLDTLAEHYDAGVGRVDFGSSGDREAARRDINTWVRETTEGLIDDIVPKLNSDARLLLVNALYLHAAWDKPFPLQLTTPGPFTRVDGRTTQATMMRTEGYCRVGYMSDERFEAVALPYRGGARMLVVAPRTDFSRFESKLDPAGFAAADHTPQTLVKLSMPRFKIATPSFFLKGPLADLGMAPAFENDADFSGIAASEGEPLFVSEVVQRAVIDVDENGTRAAAATVTMMFGSAQFDEPRRVEVVIDRPFLFFVIVHGTILFMGRVVSP